jgi:hypothetical protein
MDDLAGQITTVWQSRAAVLTAIATALKAVSKTAEAEPEIQGLIRRAHEALASLEQEMDRARRQKAA